jgi:lipopolysaccharide transport system ATP-binding protein
MGFRVLKQSPVQYLPNFHFTVPGGVYAFMSGPENGEELPPGDYVASCDIPQDLLNEGSYFVGFAISSFAPTSTVHFFEQSALAFNVRDPMEGSVGRQHGYRNTMPGIVRPRLTWAVEELRS